MLFEKYVYAVVTPGSAAYREYLALRHEVFCEELGWVAGGGEQADGAGLESDEFDVHSVHLLCRERASGIALGCCRLILPGPNGLNVSNRYAIERRPAAPASQIGEIGRLAISSGLRRHRGADGAAACTGEERRQEGRVIALGLYRELFRLAQLYGISHCYAAMRPTLARLLRRAGVPFQEAGPVNRDIQPERQPFLVGAQAVEHRQLLGSNSESPAWNSIVPPQRERPQAVPPGQRPARRWDWDHGVREAGVLFAARAIAA